ncbi:hypothetical protein HG530_013502 [Fusarium avenaceum]|nr:hypothetical protein HG530_013502 [Fusarium avenaceum]
MSKLLAVHAKGNTSIDNLAGIVQAREMFLTVLGPSLDLTGTVGLLDKSIRNSVLLVNVTLDVHVGENLDKGALSGDEPETKVLVNESLLELAVCHLAIDSLDVLLYGFFDIVEILLDSGLLDFLPGRLSGNIGNVVSVDFASILAILSHVT